MAKHLFVFGAGASNACYSTVPRRTPLAKELFNELKVFESWRNLGVDVSGMFEGNFERGMQWLIRQNQLGEPYTSCLRNFSDYFYSFRPRFDGSSPYEQLLLALKGEGILDDCTFVTLNYDCIFELIFSKFTSKSLLEIYRQSDVLKLHGSCNWLMEHGPRRWIKGTEAFDNNFDSGTTIVCDSTKINRLHWLKAIMPVYRFMTPEKDFHFQKRLFDNLECAWRGAVASAVSITIIGVNFYEPDRHIWEPLLASKARIYWVGDRPAFENFCQPGIKGEHIKWQFQDPDTVPFIIECLKQSIALAVTDKHEFVDCELTPE